MQDFKDIREEEINGIGTLNLIDACDHWQVEFTGRFGGYENHQYRVKKNAENKFEYELFLLKKCEIQNRVIREEEINGIGQDFKVIREEEINGIGTLNLIDACDHWQVEFTGRFGGYENHQYRVKKNAENKFEYELFLLKKCEIQN